MFNFCVIGKLPSDEKLQSFNTNGTVLTFDS